MILYFSEKEQEAKNLRNFAISKLKFERHDNQTLKKEVSSQFEAVILIKLLQNYSVNHDYDVYSYEAVIKENEDGYFKVIKYVN